MSESCPVTMDSVRIPGHTHTCSGAHDEGDHFCPDCKSFWWARPQ